MLPEIYWIPDLDHGRLAVMPRPRGGEWLEDEVVGWKEAGIDCVVSLLERHEIEEFELRQERGHCTAQGIEFLSFPVPDRSVPADRRALMQLARKLLDDLHVGKSVAVHCRAGIGRSALLAGAVLVLAGTTALDALSRIENARGLPVPDTEEQRQWLGEFDRALAK